MKDAKTLTDAELEDCVNGTTNIAMLREILTKHGVVDEQGWIDLKSLPTGSLTVLKDSLMLYLTQMNGKRPMITTGIGDTT